MRAVASPPFESGREQKGPEAPAPQSQSFYRRYGSVLPTSLTYIVLSARGCTPRRPAADMGTRSHDNDTASLGFSRADPGAPDGTRAVPLCGLARTRSPVDPIPGSALGGGLTKKRELSPGPGPASPSSFASPRRALAGPLSVSRLENIDSIPFRRPERPRESAPLE